MREGVVLVEDNADVSYLFKQVLDLNGITVTTSFESVEAALRYGAWSSCALVLTDYSLPGMTGIELLTWLKANHPNVKRVLVSAHPFHVIKNSNPTMDKDTVQEFVQKPFSVRSIGALQDIVGFIGGDDE